MRISDDIGFGINKSINDKGEKVAFPSVVIERINNKNRSATSFLGGQEDDYSVVIWEENKPQESQSIYIGDAALSEGAIRTWEDDASKNDNLIPIIVTSCAILGDNTDIDLILGLPLDFYSDEVVEDLKKKLKNINKIVKIAGIKGTKRVKINSVSVFPQGVGAYYSIALNLDGHIKNAEFLKASGAIIDIGYRTIDYLVMSKGKKGLKVRNNLSGSEELGIKKIYEKLQNNTEARIGKKISISKIEQAIIWNNGKLEMGMEDIDLKNDYEDICSKHAKDIISFIKFKWQDELDYIKNIGIAGGGSKVLRQYLKESFKNIVFLDEYANTYGYLAYQALSDRRNV
ncbi:MAG: ParM/StbA family protein [Clostridium tyrobutyricum]|jgi:plasmid segregation protein ParM|uniref:ParM/StbA family protein n=1 Tax=Clostridium tyrobutyricum TaxID=1519 RepID=UPI00242CB022|nr:ParM/StbA family protein [Clostridium tyrobutyricum]MCH4200157.1 ParM/StbA family protein [Clostridium tyrobutyricum]MCH4237909.1 ParM/StbA family protein [Clostridium tyrobutyricum]MCH4259725.1 ParM/StbA family protein [Clostridium tyrobutyricum]